MAAIFGPFRHSNTLVIMVVRILGSPDTLAYNEADRVVKSLGIAVWNDTHFL